MGIPAEQRRGRIDTIQVGSYMNRSTTLVLLFSAGLLSGGCRAPAAEEPIRPLLEQPGQGREVPLYGATPADNVQITRVEIDAPDLAPGLDGMRIVALSDFQIGLWSGNAAVAEAALRRAAAIEADLIVLLGDYVGRGESAEPLRRALEPVRGRPVFAVLGDRDVRTDTIQARVTAALRDAGVRLLMNDREAFVRQGDTLLIAGIDPDLITRSGGDQEWIVSQLSSRNAILLSHFPGIVGRLRDNRYAAILAGNTFCGDIEVPGAARLAYVDSVILPGVTVPDVERLYPIRRTTMFVTCGIGYGFVPARYGAVPEIALITLRRVGPPVPRRPASEAELDTLLEQMEDGDPAAEPAAPAPAAEP
jgi:predicted MPP superfamily phosphohydrolase